MPFIELSCAVGSPFDVRRFTVRESMSQTFVIEIVAVSPDASIDLDTIVNNTASLKLDTGVVHALRSHRYWAGYVQHAEQSRAMLPWRDGSAVLSTYYLRIVPRLWLLSQRKGYRIFQHQTIPDIIDKLLGEWGIPIDWQIARKDYPKLEYKAQYGENDFALFSRLLEEAGITYAFVDKDGEMLLTLTDAPTVRALRTASGIRYFDQREDATEQEYATSLRMFHDVRPGALSRVDYDFRNPNKRMLAEGEKSGGSDAFYEQYEYEPGRFLIEGSPGQTPIADDRGASRYEMNYGTDGARKSLVADRTGRRAIEFETNVLDLGPGTVFTIENHPHDALTEELMVTGFEITGAHDGDWQMVTRAVFRADPYRPARITPKPKVTGVQSATVVGPSAQEIHVDEFGRVRVQFPWDREGKNDDESSVWIRVSQGWAGVHYGMICIPRIGQEVLVGFLDGDPDDPIIVGRAYNAVNPVPYKLPDNKTVSGWKSHSSPTNGGYNELKIEDKANKELIYVQAQKDLHKLVKRDWTERIGRHHHRTILEDQHLIVVKTKKELIKKDDQLHVVGDRMQKIDKSTSLTVGVDQDEKIGNKHALEAGKEIHFKAGDKVVIEAGAQLTIKGAGGFLAIHPGGVDIVGTLVRINSGGSPAGGTGAKPTEPKDAEEAFPKDHSEDIKD
ncbi:MAG: type VI secretion system tip protein VgrG [Polyangiaceae bacterium]|nr:type VI secretion system tip protein VgrG [Polyangiaceae bacterium]